MKTEPTIEQEFANHRAKLQAGWAAMSPEPPRRYTNPNPQPPPPAEPVQAEPAPEDTTAAVLREGGIEGRFDLRWVGVANVESLTTGIPTKKELARLAEIQGTLEKLAEHISKAATAPINLGKLAATFAPGELPPAEAVAAALAGDEGRMATKRLAKESARRFFEEQADPLIRELFPRVADLLKARISERHQAEREAFEKFVEVYGDDDTAAPYRPSTGLLRLCSRRREILDMEFPRVSPPSLRGSLSGILAF